MSNLLRGGRIGSIRKDVVEFTASIKSDIKLLESVIRINQAHILMLTEQKIITSKIGSKILSALDEIDTKMTVSQFLEDIHLAVEEEVNKKVGLDIGGNLHIAKSRNDQVSTAIRMTLRNDIFEFMNILVKLQKSLIKLAEKQFKEKKDAQRDVDRLKMEKTILETLRMALRDVVQPIMRKNNVLKVSEAFKDSTKNYLMTT